MDNKSQPKPSSISEPFLSSELFRQVQMSGMFEDSKTFADAKLKTDWPSISQGFDNQSNKPDFDLNAFVEQHFTLPEPTPAHDPDLYHKVGGDLRRYIDALWPLLEREPDKPAEDSLIPLKEPYVVPGGRFREIYYWDSYFTGLGLLESGRPELLKSMISNFIQLQEEVGCIPNGNRHYYRTRSQPPVLALMIELFCGFETQDEKFLTQCVAGLTKEYQFWMQGADKVSPNQPAYKRVIALADGSVLNRFWDDSDSPRPESYKEDLDSAEGFTDKQKSLFFRNIRAACESGWDFSARWLQDKNDLSSIRTTEILPVDLNCLMYKLELQLGTLHQQLGNQEQARLYRFKALMRKNAIQRYMWDENKQWFCDYDWQNHCRTDVMSLAGVVPLFVGVVEPHQTEQVASCLMNDFLTTGGLVTTLSESAQQWDTPNGWAPLHWFAVKGLLNCGFERQAKVIMQLWVTTVEQHFESHGHLMEKYNVLNPDVQATGGEYEVQHGFGWTNGVTLAFYKLLEKAL